LVIVTTTHAVADTLRAAGCVFAEDEARLLVAAAGTSSELDGMVNRRITGVPLEQVLGWAEFCGLRIGVEPGVFVPRRRSQFLAEQAIDALSATAIAPTVVDLCCGSGAVGAAVASAIPGTRLHAVDIDPVAVACAARNLRGVGGHAYRGDLFHPLPDALRRRVDLLVANAPYVPSHALGLLPPEARLHEPRIALDGGADGLDVQRRVIAAAPEWLAPGGHILVETSEEQAPSTAQAFTEAGLRPRVTMSEELGATVVMGDVPGEYRPVDDRSA
jgi:release factor glutamine methyltransferase